MVKRCQAGTRKCISGACVKKSQRNSKRCSKGTRKCADQYCYSEKKTPLPKLLSATPDINDPKFSKIRKN